jgi:AcrR family transcriptional regulator
MTKTEITQRRRDPVETRSRILSAAFELFNQRPLHELHSNHIAVHAGVAVGSFYKYFETKEAVFLACYDEWVKTEWTAIGLWTAKPPSKASVPKLVKLLLAEHERAVMFRKNLNALCYQSEAAQQHRDRQRLQQCRDMEAMFKKMGIATPPLIQLHAALNTCEFLLDAWSTGRHEQLGLTIKAIENELAMLISGFLKGMPS